VHFSAGLLGPFLSKGFFTLEKLVNLLSPINLLTTFLGAALRFIRHLAADQRPHNFYLGNCVFR
jgi:hypothetical protein